jgi:zinc protease
MICIHDAVPAKGKTTEEVEAALRQQIKRMREEAVSDEEMQRAKTQILTGRVYEQDSVFYQGMQLGVLETVGIGWQADEVFNEKIKAVTAEQIQAVANKYLIKDRLTVTILDPLPIETPKDKVAKAKH